MKHEKQTPDWAEMIEQLKGRGLSTRDISNAMGADITDRMLNHYRAGTQPMHWRGEGLIALWCKTLELERSDLPLMLLVRGHRVDRNRVEEGPRLQRLPSWPAKVVAAAAGVRRKKAKAAA